MEYNLLHVAHYRRSPRPLRDRRGHWCGRHGGGLQGARFEARRDVAIKTLPAELARNQERLSRFEREAKLLAVLNHPAVTTLYGLEEHDSTLFLVMELVEGETLAARIERGKMPAKEAVPLFGRIADALDAAHEKSVVHRDLKPANIMITLDGKPKILDFGLAKTFQKVVRESDGSQSPTLTKGTALGVIMERLPT